MKSVSSAQSSADDLQEKLNPSPFAHRQPSGFQFSMGSLVVLMVVFSTASATLLWASRLPLVTNEIHIWLGTTPAANQDGTDRGTQLIFLLFCYSAPLLMAGLIHSSLLLLRWIESRSTLSIDEEEFDDQLGF